MVTTRTFSIAVFLFVACAKQGFPPGGPVDKKPPMVIRTSPENGARNVNRDIKVEIWFDEWIKAQNASDAVFISPYPGEDVKKKISRSKLTIIFPDRLLADKTYVITAGTALRDFRNNALENSYTLAFSTGPVLDTGAIEGQVFVTGKAQGLDVWAYQLSDTTDTDPSRVTPDYAVQCDESGQFVFSHLAPGRYRLFAIKDRVADRLYQPMEDEIGLTFRDVLLDSSTQFKTDGLGFRLTREDTLAPILGRAMGLSPKLAGLQFSEPVLFDSSQFDWIRVSPNSDSLQTLSIQSAYTDPASNRKVLIWSEDFEAGQSYRVDVFGITDRVGIPMDSAGRSAEFDISAEPDTTAPEFPAVTPKPRSRNVPLNTTIRFLFEEPMDTASAAGIVLADTAGLPVAVQSYWNRPSELVLKPVSTLKNLIAYTVRIKPDSVMDRFGNVLPDSTWKFNTLHEDTLGAISGTISDADTESHGPLIVTVYPARTPEDTQTQILETPGSYLLPELFPGMYRIEAFRDEDKNGTYSFGTPNPFNPAERFFVYEDTIKVRARWPNEGNDFELPRR